VRKKGGGGAGGGGLLKWIGILGIGGDGVSRGLLAALFEITSSFLEGSSASGIPAKPTYLRLRLRLKLV